MGVAGNARQLRFVKYRECSRLGSLLQPSMSQSKENNLNMPKTHNKTKKRKSKNARKRTALNNHGLKIITKRCGCTLIESDCDGELKDYLASMLGDLRRKLKRAVYLYEIVSEAKMPHGSAIPKRPEEEIVTQLFAAWKNQHGTWTKCGRCDICLASNSIQ
ncbi:unnamed protein product, partial [Brenthis ino]